jgi:hypothetical protein
VEFNYKVEQADLKTDFYSASNTYVSGNDYISTPENDPAYEKIADFMK